MSAFAVFNDDKSKVEIFIPNEKNSNILEKFKSEEDVYRNDNFMFDASTSVLYINGEKKFVAEKK